MKTKIAPYLENVTEAACACLITMVQGNVIALGFNHWIIASQTGLIAGTIAATTILTAKLRRQWVISLTLGSTTAFVDFHMHPGSFGIIAVIEAVFTGVGAALLSCLLNLFYKFRKRRAPAAEVRQA